MHKFSLNRLDFPILLPAFLMVTIGLASFYSIDFLLFKQQLIFLFLSFIAYLIFLNIDYKLFRLFSKQLYFLMIFLLLTLFLLGIEARGAVRWIDLFGIRVQFSEIIKPFFIIFLAQYLTTNESRSLSKFLKALALMAPFFFLILRQPDLGNAMIYFFTTILMLLVFGFPFFYFIGLAFVLILPFPVFFTFLHDYQKERILTFIDPTRDPFGSSYNVIQSLISIGSGGWFGKGFGEATQSILKFLPERHTDFIFASISESIGFVGAIFLMGLFIFLLTRIYKISRNAHEVFPNLVLMGFYFLFMTHIFLNIGMNIGIVPIVGVTLPFVSYGGSSLLTSFIMLGIISSIKFDYKKSKPLEIV
ncbi:MAG: hypothetical protein A3C27_03810 [Candidatus Levybacteria bacterium RIFCSPHIGHO2_02_FULL_39_36]|nr:MAG: Cell shape-determining protein RodA [Candidatus Levybacteria bacterium GW2011_GWA1_39_11]KKR24594.1 MAG: Cell shape-determining protein RodA [Candidatus Levybacteria bacterium GW2011_GWB1_39_7]OGH15345.1 MAG: hypothetical protein A2689_02070 [Candidatus Levybacteria bacterium RIFCSPHIGHO2_01_FULL_38_96]OGH26002.1 MAG: hypothetical protein A3E68_03125 [Candidatus Levybacteria bacterium RIFCSPHIGHO2_12_FULL_39_39]OGH28844.1 MAG: hypothetical protein A3C27_03810 [Candidatus Levybacteria ba